MKKTKQPSGQIMVIILLVLSVLSIIALTITIATVRDTQEQVDNKKYQAYYSVGERLILDVQNSIGKDPAALTNPAGIIIKSDATDYIYSGNPCVSGTAVAGELAVVDCTLEGILASDFVNSANSEKLDVQIKITDYTEISNEVVLGQDQDLLLKLSNDKTKTNKTDLTWTTADAIDWNISLDYKVEEGGKTVFKTKKLIYISGNIYAAPDPATNKDGCFEVSGTPSNPNSTITLTTKFTDASCVGTNIIPLYYRLKPVGGDAKIQNLVKTDTTEPLQRVIKTVTTSSVDSANVSNQQNPTSVLSTTYLLTQSPLSLFDYVLRTEQPLVKD